MTETRAQSGRCYQVKFSQFSFSISLFYRNSSLLRNVGNCGYNILEVNNLMVEFGSEQRSNCRNSLYFPCLSGESGSYRKPKKPQGAYHGIPIEFSVFPFGAKNFPLSAKREIGRELPELCGFQGQICSRMGQNQRFSR